MRNPLNRFRLQQIPVLLILIFGCLMPMMRHIVPELKSMGHECESPFPGSAGTAPEKHWFANGVSQDSLLPPDHSPVGEVLQKLRKPRLIGRSRQIDSCAFPSEPERPTKTLGKSDCSDSDIKFVFCYFRSHACPVRAGPPISF